MRKRAIASRNETFYSRAKSVPFYSRRKKKEKAFLISDSFVQEDSDASGGAKDKAACFSCSSNKERRKAETRFLTAFRWARLLI